jgi:hypothetical protein
VKHLEAEFGDPPQLTPTDLDAQCADAEIKQYTYAHVALQFTHQY